MSMIITATPRSWFLSLTAIWLEAAGFHELRSALEASLEAHPLAGHQILLPVSAWHSTAFAILKITGVRNTEQSGSEHAASLLHKLREEADIVQKIRQVFRPFTVTAKERRCFDDSTTVQFVDSPDLESFRKAIRPILEGPVATMVSHSTPSCKLESLLYDQNKSQGNRFFGSIARSPFPCDSSFFRWELPLSPISLTFNRIHLLVSDDALTNPRDLDTDIPIFPNVAQ